VTRVCPQSRISMSRPAPDLGLRLVPSAPPVARRGARAAPRRDAGRSQPDGRGCPGVLHRNDMCVPTVAPTRRVDPHSPTSSTRHTHSNARPPLTDGCVAGSSAHAREHLGSMRLCRMDCRPSPRRGRRRSSCFLLGPTRSASTMVSAHGKCVLESRPAQA